jgi:hypothetical protein
VCTERGGWTESVYMHGGSGQEDEEGGSGDEVAESMVLDVAAAVAEVEGRRRRRRSSKVNGTAALLMAQRLQEDEGDEARVVAHIRRHRRLAQPQHSDSEGDDQQGEGFHHPLCVSKGARA